VVHFELGTSKRQLVASPSYLAKRGTPKVPGDLHQHDIINYETRGLKWTFEGKTGPLVVQIEPRITSNNAFYLIDATCSGNGICLMSNYAIKPFVQRGELVTVLDAYPIPDLSVRMHIPENRLEFTHVQALRTHLLASIKKSELLTQGSSP
jgi:DNA-binding transcriptional LysR family regulator